MIGRKLGPYEILASIGAGGMGEVYRARDTRLERVVAIKVLPEHLSQNPEVRQRFEREARSVSSLNHPHICTLHDVGHEDGVDFLVMEYLEGETLGDRLAKGPLPTADLLRYATQIADALDKAHRQGLVHRDLKPGNVMITKAGAKLLDFGLARATGLAPSVSDLTSSPTVSQPLTAEGTIVGTFQYMAPEQLEGSEADARSDIFSFGAVLYEMATGRKAFEGRSQASLIGAIMNSEPAPVSQVAPMSPPALDRVVRQCLAKDPDARYQSAHDLKLQLEWIAEGGSQAGVPAPVAARRRIASGTAWAAAAAFAVLSAVLAVLLWQRAAVRPTVIKADIPPPENTAYELNGLHPGPATLSPDGTRITFVATSPGGRPGLWVRRLDQGQAVPLPGTEGAGYPFWSPDSRFIGFFANGKLLKVDASGGPPLQLCDASVGKGGTWSKDDVILFAPTFNGPIHRVSAAGGVSTPVTTLEPSRGENSHRFPQFLADGRRFFYFSRSGAAVSDSLGSALRVTSLDGKVNELVMRTQYRCAYASGHLLFIRQGTLMAQRFDTGKLALVGDPFPLAERVTLLPGARVGVFTASDNGVLAYQAGTGNQAWRLVWFDRNGTAIEAGDEELGFGDPELSPDGRMIAVPIFDELSGTADIWIYEVDRGIRTRFTFDPGSDVNPLWSPDGSRILFSSSREGNFDVYEKAVGGASEEKLLYASDTGKFLESWSRDGRYLVMQVVGLDTRSDIWVYELNEGKDPVPFVQTGFDEFGGQVSPDARWLAYVSNESGAFEIYVTTFPKPGRKWQVSTSGGTDCLWRGDGRELFYVARDGALTAVELEPQGASLSIGRPRKLFQFSSTDDYDVTRDGQRFVASVPADTLAASPLHLVLNWTEEIKGR